MVYVVSLLIAAIGANIGGRASATVGPHRAGAQAAVAHHTRFVYVANRQSNTVSEYRVDRVRGITRIGAITAGSGPTIIRTDPMGPYAYVLDRGQHGEGNPIICEYRIDSRGRLGKIGQIAEPRVSNIAIGPKGRRLYAADDTGTVHEYAIGPHGILRRATTAKVAPAISQIGIAAAGRYLIGVNSADTQDPDARTSTIYEYKIAHDGALTSIGAYATGASPLIAMDPARSYFYVANAYWKANKIYEDISEYAVGHAGALRSIGTVSVTNSIMSIAVSKNGKYLSVTSLGMLNGTIAQYAIRRDGRLKKTACGPMRVASAIAVGSNEHVYVTTQGYNTLSEYVGRPDGRMAAFGTVTVRNWSWDSPGALTFDPADRYAYLVHTVSLPEPAVWGSSISEYAVGPHGLLTKLPATVSTPSPNPIHMAIGGRYAYQLDETGRDQWILEYRVGPHGHLVPIARLPTAASVNSLAIDPAAPYLYVAGDSVKEYAIGPHGHLQSIGSLHLPRPSLPGLPIVVIGPAGRHLYVVWSGTIRKYDIGTRGRLAQRGTIVMTSKEGSNDFVIDPGGRYAYGVELTYWSVHHSRGHVVVYAIQRDGHFEKIERSATLRFVAWPRIDPQGRFLYLSSGGGRNRIAAYRIPPDGRPVFIGKGFPGIYSVHNMTMSPTGKYLYVADQVSTMDKSTLTTKGYAVYSVASIEPDGKLSVLGVRATGAGHGRSSVATTPY